MVILADIASGHTTGADVLFLAAFVIFVLAVLAHFFAPSELTKAGGILIPIGLACVALAWLLL